jgi:hypothetical protein
MAVFLFNFSMNVSSTIKFTNYILHAHEPHNHEQSHLLTDYTFRHLKRRLFIIFYTLEDLKPHR